MRLGKRTRKEVDVSSSGDEMFLLWNINGKLIRQTDAQRAISRCAPIYSGRAALPVPLPSVP